MLFRSNFHLVNVKTKLTPLIAESEEQHEMLCRLSIAPIVVSKDIVGGGSTTDHHDQAKRARHQYNMANNQDMMQVQHQELKFPLITHFVMQLEMYDNEQDGDSMESLSSSDSVDGRQLVDTKSNTNVSSQVATVAHPPDETKSGPSGSSNNNNQLGDHSVMDQEASNVEGTDMDGSISVQSSDREPIVAIG